MAPEFKALGANVCEMSLIATKEMEIERDKFTLELELATHILLTSANGVDIFFEKIKKYDLDIRSLHNKKICVIGSGSASALKKYGVRADFIPSKFDSRSFLEEMVTELNEKSRVLMLRAKLGNDILPNGLKAAGIKFCDIPIYDTIIDYRRKFELNKEIKNFDYIVLASASAAKALCEIIEDMNALKERVVSIGPMTTKALMEFGIEEVITANQYDVKGIVYAIRKL